jgi:hypothetical protein
VLALASNRLLVEGTPTPTDALWAGLLQAVEQRSRTA